MKIKSKEGVKLNYLYIKKKKKKKREKGRENPFIALA